MNSIANIMLVATFFSLLAWIYLIYFRGKFWNTDSQFRLSDSKTAELESWPTVCVIIPARNEADTIPHTIPSLLKQAYPGAVHLFLVDDGSSDGTGSMADSISREQNALLNITVVSGKPLQKNWTGKLWAIQQGIQASSHLNPKYFLFTDADILHYPTALESLVYKAEKEHRDMVSLMVKLNVSTFWEKILIPAFVFFFAKLYPFKWVNTKNRREAAAAGGCILIRKRALSKIGGLERFSNALIDDITLARLVKTAGGSIWLGLTENMISLRPYHGFTGVWNMVSRTAFTQLRHSPLLLAGTILGMTIIYLMPPISSLMGLYLLMGNGFGAKGVECFILGSVTWMMMSKSFKPMLSWYGIGAWHAPLLSLAGFLYTLMTIDSAIRHYVGKGGGWKGRTYRV